jgi:hypothetical protein
MAIFFAATLCIAAQARADTMPKSELDFVATINDARIVYDAQAGAAKKTALVKEMIKRWKTIIPDGVIKGWTGQIVDMGTNNAGKIYLAIRIADRINLMTWKKAFPDLGHHTLIPKGSPLFAALSGLKAGDSVRFDGKYQSFVNLKERAKVFDTDLIVMFTAIAPAR